MTAMKTTGVTLLVVLALAAVEARAQQEKSTVFDKVHWQRGPSVGNLGDIAEVRVPAGYVFAEANDTRVLMEAMQNPTNGHELGFLAPATLDWFMVFEFDDIGYVRDDEKGSLDADAMLES